jgi:site-specific DNA-methyltransferase (adenine-specific)
MREPALILGDCLEWMLEIPDKSVDMVLCDLPYGNTCCKWDVIIPFEPLWKQYRRICKAKSAIVLMASQPFASLLVASNLKWFRYDLIWEKTSATGHLNAKRMPMRAHELILVFYNHLPTYNPIKTSGHVRKTARAERFRLGSELYGKEKGTTFYDSTERYPRSVLKFASDKQKLCLHPCQKPVALMEYLVRTFTSPGDIVLDNAMGSGTTGVAAKNAGRNFMGIEKDKAYFNTASKRILQ